MKKFLVTYRVSSLRMAEIEAEDEDSAYDHAAHGCVLDTEIDSDYQENVSCEEVTDDT